MVSAMKDRCVFRISYLYASLLGRHASPAEMRGWVDRCEAARDRAAVMQTIEAEFKSSAEYKLRQRTDCEQRVRNLYELLLNRRAGDSEMRGWVNRCSQAAKIDEAIKGIEAEFKRSDEYRRLHGG